MLMYGPVNATNISFAGKGVILNLTSMREGFTTLPLVIPPNYIGRTTGREFDIQYMHYILDNDGPFCEFFQIIYNLYIGNDVFIITDEADWSENILESLLKLIQQRYGYNAVYVSNDEDYIYARNNSESGFAVGPGLYNLDQDKDRFSYIMERARLHNPEGRLPYNLEGFIVGDDYGE